MEDGNNPIQHASGSEIKPTGEFRMVEWTLPDGRTYPNRIEDVTHFRTAESGDYEHPIGTLFGMHDKTMYDLYGYSTLGRQRSTIPEDEELIMIHPQPKNRKRTQRVTLLYMLLLFASGVAAALIIQHFTWGQLN